MRASYLFVAVNMLISVPAMSKTPDIWTVWHGGLNSRCPDHHVEWMEGSAYDEFLGAFYRTLTPRERHAMNRQAAYSRLCAKERVGFSCEMGTNLAAARRLGLLPRLTAFACRTVNCEERGICSRSPR